ncbi:uncharacterized GPI-anchored protein At3g06035 [Ricinus communis]|uniref:Uncharacterized GPI-anchored protein At5g19230-like domain-containing protein n=1 Tax=Ricinus communis TaxID=3988 RepID=B9RF48_RICCO|nr:uncharacterized GPI-anchored protein At3g06035 [Ricinus communis]EEF49819.1 conserved hypothetical protein [Ricinus communis]|eukprot:XP_002512367.1 uncharacterized GPI-anchored protein At3g06035 [Ricinus communis]
MASLKVALFLPLPLLLLLAISLLSSPVHCDDEEDILITCLNSHRAYLNLPVFVKNEGADCLADEVARELGDEPCNKTNTNNPFQVDHNITDLISKCDINITHTKDGAVLPVCVPELEPIAVFTNYTRTHFAKYINDSRFAQVGIGSEGEWMVIVLSTNTSRGDFAAFAGTNSLVSAIGFGHCLVSFLLGMLFYLAN